MTELCDRKDCTDHRRQIEILRKRVEAQDDTIRRFSDVWSVEEETIELRARIRRLEDANRRLAEGGRKPEDMMEQGE